MVPILCTFSSLRMGANLQVRQDIYKPKIISACLSKISDQKQSVTCSEKKNCIADFLHLNNASYCFGQAFEK